MNTKKIGINSKYMTKYMNDSSTTNLSNDWRFIKGPKLAKIESTQSRRKSKHSDKDNFKLPVIEQKIDENKVTMELDSQTGEKMVNIQVLPVITKVTAEPGHKSSMTVCMKTDDQVVVLNPIFKSQDQYQNNKNDYLQTADLEHQNKTHLGSAKKSGNLLNPNKGSAFVNYMNKRVNISSAQWSPLTKAHVLSFEKSNSNTSLERLNEPRVDFSQPF